MEELRKIFLDANVPQEQIDGIIAGLELSNVDDLRFYIESKDFTEVGAGKLASKKLAEAAKAIRADFEMREIKAKEIETAEMDANADLNLLVEDIKEDVWLESLRQTGLIRFEAETYIAGIKAMLAGNLGVFGAIEKLANMIKDYSVKNALPCPKSYYALLDVIAQRQYGAAFAALTRDEYDGIPIYATMEDMLDLIRQIQSDLVPHIINVAEKLNCWYSDLTAQKTSDFFVEKTIGGSIQRQYESYPSPAAIYDAALELRTSINRTFAGNGVQKAMAIFGEYSTFVKTINDPDLPKAVGMVDRDAILTALGLNANAAAVRSESQIVKFVLSTLDARKLAAVSELQFFRELYALMMQIDWSALTGRQEDANLFSRQSSPIGSMITGPAMNSGLAVPERPQIGMQSNQFQDGGLRQLDGTRVELREERI